MLGEPIRRPTKPTAARRALARLGCVAAVGLAACSGSDPDAGLDNATVSSTVSETVAGSPTIITDRPPIPPDDVLSERLDQLPTTDAPELRAALASSADWAGTLTGALYRRLPDGQWKLCFETFESYPEQCGTHVDLSREPAIRSKAPNGFEVQNDPETGVPRIEISQTVTITGVFLYDSLLFVPDAIPAN